MSGSAASAAATASGSVGATGEIASGTGTRPASRARRIMRSAYDPVAGISSLRPGGTKVRTAASVMKWPQPCSGSVACSPGMPCAIRSTRSRMPA